MATALVTGGTAGIGWAFARSLADHGHDIVLVARDANRLEVRAAELRSVHGVQVEVLAADLSDRGDLQRVADRVGSGASPVDLLVNNAGFGLKTAFTQGPLADEERMLDVLVRAVLVTSHAAATAMRERGRGSIINVSSVAGFAPTMGSYSAAKSWVTAFSEGLSRELAGTGVRVVALCPGYVRTEFHQRAEMGMKRLPQLAWLDADNVVETAMEDLRKGRSVSVPSKRYKLVTAVLTHAPRAVVRRATVGVGRRGRGAALGLRP